MQSKTSILLHHPTLHADLIAQSAAIATDHTACCRRYELLLRDAHEQLDHLLPSGNTKRETCRIATASFLWDRAGGCGAADAVASLTPRWRCETAPPSHAMCSEMAAAMVDMLVRTARSSW